MSKRTEKKQAWLKENGPCQRCGSIEGLDIHHIDPYDRIAEDLWVLAEEKRQDELSKCTVLCQSCHIDVHTEMKRNGYRTKYNPKRKLILCKECNRYRPPKGRGLCDSCYRTFQRKNKIIVCEDCGKEKNPYTSTLCNACYSKRSRKNPAKRRLVICKKCGREAYHEGKGMCGVCYKRDYNENFAKIIVCKDCGEEKNHHSNGLCAKCYMRRKRAKK